MYLNSPMWRTRTRHSSIPGQYHHRLECRVQLSAPVAGWNKIGSLFKEHSCFKKKSLLQMHCEPHPTSYRGEGSFSTRTTTLNAAEITKDWLQENSKRPWVVPTWTPLKISGVMRKWTFPPDGAQGGLQRQHKKRCAKLHSRTLKKPSWRRNVEKVLQQSIEQSCEYLWTCYFYIH